ncbi:hypothetical protein [Legionella jamestowniensis]|uniref:Coiled-coil-containing protein n=1 Tax=Legionella jamestowniensis TaxID=455 RepID=A0A0W0UJM6_9GAMM|nr:hypothetical protein [Legionella jamestowniensis]KTD08088.1 coiled-coil-containing protein [Legionella jamestowniensis]SFM09400.1 hypothetical protein SAMN02746073_0394 [Legionella jamestowniensis DSM 19215]
MSKNTLFNFIGLHFTKDIFTSECTKVVLDRNKEESLYYRLELAPTKVELRDKSQAYKLLNHHISIYETERRDNPQLSQYHYTAYFTNAEGEVFRLHVYFNANDELTMNASFSKEEEIGYTPIETPRLEDAFINLAITHVRPVIAQLRKKHKETVKQLEVDFAALEKEAAELLQQGKEHTEEYVGILDNICGVLTDLTPLVRHNLYSKNLHFFQNIQKSLAIEPSDIIDVAEKSSPFEPTKDNSSESEETNQSSKKGKSIHSTQQSEGKKSRKPINTFMKEFRGLDAEMKLLKDLERTLQAQKLEDFLSRIQAFSLTHKQNRQNLTVFAQLQSLYRETQSLGEKVLPTLLFEKKFDLAKQLVSWHHLLDEKYLNLSLQTRNHELLDFILTYGDFNLNNQPVTIKNITYPSAIQVCFDLHSHQSSMGDCLSILLKHGASLCMGDTNGFPFAYSIMSVPNHPFKEALLANRDKTLDSVKFLKELRLLLKHCLSSNQLSQDKSESILEEIDYCNSRLNFLSQPDLNTASGKIYQKKSDEFVERHLSKIIKKLRSDPEIMLLSAQLDASSKRLLQMIGKGRTRSAQRQVANTLDSLDKLLVEQGITIDSFEQVRKDTIEQMQGQLLLINKKIELTELQKEITRRPVIVGKSNKAQRNLDKQQRTLLSEISELEKKYDLQHHVEKTQKLSSELKQFETATKELEKMLNSFSLLQDSLTRFMEALPEVDGEGEVLSENAQSDAIPLVEMLTKFSSIFQSPPNGAKNDESQKNEKKLDL